MKARQTSSLEAKLNYRFQRPELLLQALTHSSHSREQESQQSTAETSRVPDNEELEFLGDAVLTLVTSETLLHRYPQFREGQLSKLRAYLVSEEHLIRAARHLRIGSYLRLGRGEEKSGGRSKTALQVDALEAMLAAMYLDSGLDEVRRFILDAIIEPELKRLKRVVMNGFPITDFKSALQEATHSCRRPQPTYTMIGEHGPEHQKTFTIEARIYAADDHGNVEYSAHGTGPTKKKAEQDAARQALEYLWSLQAEFGDKQKPRRSPRSSS